MLRKSNVFKMIMIGVLWVVPMGIWLTCGALPAEAESGVRPITPMWEMGDHRVNVRAHDYFDVVGILHLIENDRIIVGDSELKFAPGVKMSRARQYNTVGVKLNNLGEVVVLEIVSDEPN